MRKLCFAVGSRNSRASSERYVLTFLRSSSSSVSLPPQMKNKPHPRWARRAAARQSSRTQSDQKDIDHLDSAQPEIVEDEPTDPTAELGPISSATSRPSGLQMPSIYLSPVSFSPGPASSCESLMSPQDPSFLSAFIPSPASSSSSNSPLGLSPQLPQVRVDDMSYISGPDSELEDFVGSASLDRRGLEEALYDQILEQMMRLDRLKSAELNHCDHQVTASHSPMGGNCGCVNDPQAYDFVRDLSDRLRRATDALGNMCGHSHGSVGCELYSRISELDRLAA